MKNNLIFKLLTIAVLVIILSNFIITNFVYGADPGDDVDDYLIDDIGDDKFQDVGKQESEDALGGMTEDEFNQKLNNAIDLFGEEETGPEGVLFTPITQFLLAIADSVMSTMQGAFIGSGTTLGNILHSNEIKIKTPDGKNVQKAGITRYALRYTPKAIFSGEIPAFDTNFFSPMGNNNNGVVEFANTNINFKYIKQLNYNSCIANYGATGNLLTSKDKFTAAEAAASALSIICTINAIEALANIDNDVDWAGFGIGGGGSFLGIGGEVDVDFSAPIFEFDIQGIASTAMFTAGAVASGATYAALELQDTNMYYSEWKDNAGKSYFFIAESSSHVDGNERNELNGALYEIQESTTNIVNEKYSAAFQLQPVISKWYIGLRNFSVVGLLSVLIYVAIRIIIASTSDQKAKYKKMLVDWLVAICLLFLLHYIMVFITHISELLCNIFETNSSLSDGTDIFATKIRNMATGDGVSSYMQYFGFVVIYIALVILTVIFTIQYTKRLILLAFLTIIAPLIALVYPIDTMSGGKSQAFSYWLKEYIFNSLLQPMHLLLYTIFISSAYELMDMNPVYAIIVLSFFVSAEQIFRKIFGFDKANTVSPLGAATGGAMMMNMLNKLKGSTSRRGDNPSNEKGIRMASDNMGNSVDNFKDSQDSHRNNASNINKNESNNNINNKYNDSKNNWNDKLGNGLNNSNNRHDDSEKNLDDDLGNIRRNELSNNDNDNNYDYLNDNLDDNLGNIRQNELSNNDDNNYNYLNDNLDDNLSNIRQDELSNNDDNDYNYLNDNLDDNLSNIRQNELSDNNDNNYLIDNGNSSNINPDKLNDNNNYKNLASNSKNNTKVRMNARKLNNNSNYKNLASDSKNNTKVKENTRKSNVKQGVKNVAKGMAKRGIKGATTITKTVFKKAPGAVLGATLGIAAAVVSGGQNATSLIEGGAVAGATISNNIEEKVSDTVKGGIKKVKEDYDKGAKQQANNKKEKEKKQTADKKEIEKKQTDDKREVEKQQVDDKREIEKQQTDDKREIVKQQANDKKETEKNYNRGTKKRVEREKSEGYKKIMKDKKTQEISEKDDLEVKDSIKFYTDIGMTDSDEIRANIEGEATHPDKLGEE